MIERALDQIDEADLQGLLGRPEGRRLEYKEQLAGGGNEASEKFLAEIISLANTDGGDLIIGIREQDATAAEVVGIPDEGINETITAIENKVRDGIEPRLSGFHIHRVALANGRAALVLRVSTSLVAPHRVINSNRFYARNSRGKYPMDVGQLRLAFAATEDMPEKMRALHAKAVAAASGDGMPTQMVPDAPIAIVTIAPLTVLREAHDVEFDQGHALLPVQPGENAMNSQFVVCLEGMLVHAFAHDGAPGVNAWAMNHRKGYIDFSWRLDFLNIENNQAYVHPSRFRNGIIGASNSAVGRLRERGLEGPWTIMASLRGVAGYEAILNQHFATQAAWVDAPYLGDIVDENLGEVSLMPLIKAFWRVFGEANPPNQG